MVQDANSIQQYFSSEQQPTLWRSIPAIKELQTAWEAKLTVPKYIRYKRAIQNGLDKLGKYYQKFDDKPVYILALGMQLYFYSCLSEPLITITVTVLHPYYKLAYIKMQ